MKRCLLSILGIVLFVGVLAANVDLAESQTTDSIKPIVIVAFSGYNELVRNADFIGQLAGAPDLADKLENLIHESLKVEDLAGLDKVRPWGVVSQINDMQSSRYVFIPVTDLGQFLQSIEPTVGKPTETGDGVWEINVRDQTVFVREKNGWALFSDGVESFDNVPDDPSKAVSRLLDTYDIGIQVMMKNIPPLLRQIVLGGLQMSAMQGLNQMEGMSDAERRMRTLAMQQTFQRINKAAANTDTIQLGLSIDREDSLGILEFTLIPTEESATAKQFTKTEPVDSPLAGLNLSNALVSFHSALRLQEDNIRDFQATLAQRREVILAELNQEDLNASERKQAEQTIDQLVEVIDETLEAGQIDVAVALRTDIDSGTLIAGIQIADSPKLEKFVKQMIQRLGDDSSEMAKDIQLDAGEHLGVRFHTIAVPVEPFDLDPQMKQALGETIDVVIGFDKSHVYLSAGLDPIETLKTALDEAQSAGPRPILPFHLVFDAAVIARNAAEKAEGEAQEKASEIADLLEQSDGKSNVSITGVGIGKGLNVRIELQEGLLKLIGSIPALVPPE